MENDLFSILEEDAQDRNTHRACLRAVARAQKQFGSFFKQAASEEDFMARLDLVHDRINDVVREACVEEGSTSLDTVARVLAGELARTSEVMRDDVKEEDIAPSDGEDDEMHVRGVAGRLLLGLDDQEGESKTAAPRKKPPVKYDPKTDRLMAPKKRDKRPPKPPPDPNPTDSLDPMKNKNVVRTPGEETPMGKPKNQKQLDWDKKNKNKLQKEPAWQDDGATNKSLRELDGEKKLVPKKSVDAATDILQAVMAAPPEVKAQLREILGLDGEGYVDDGYDQGDPMYGEDTNDMFPNGGYESKVKTAVETGDTYTQETVDLPSATPEGSDEPSPKMDKGTAGDENHTSQKPIDIPSVQLNPEVQDVTDPADYTATLEVPGVLETVNADTPMQPEHNVAPGTETFPNKDQANPITSKWKVLG